MRRQHIRGPLPACLVALASWGSALRTEAPANRTKVDEFVSSVAALPYLNPYLMPAVVLDTEWGGMLRVLNGRVEGARSLHRTDAVVVRLTSTVDLRTRLEMGPVTGVLGVVLTPARIVGPPFAASVIYRTRRSLSFEARAVSMNFSAGTEFESGKARLQALVVRKVLGMNATLDTMDSYGHVVNLFMSVLNRHAERVVRYLVEDVLRTVMAEVIRSADISADSLLKSFLRP
ncbi:uncharacterized protein LOC144094641 [Amblyomma americanum]